LTSSPYLKAGDSKNHFLDFLLPSLTGFSQLPLLSRRFGLMFALQTNPASPAVLTYRFLHKILMYFDFKDVYRCLCIFPRSTTFSAPLQSFANFVVRVYVSRVSGGSVTDLSISDLFALLTRLISPWLKQGVLRRLSDKLKIRNLRRAQFPVMVFYFLWLRVLTFLWYCYLFVTLGTMSSIG
jgi:hypothetical protein